MCDKSNAMTHAGGLWQRVFKEVSGEYPQITAQHMYVDALCMQMVRDPRQFDVIVTNNMFGDIITDLAAGLQGGLGHGRQRQHPSRQDINVRTSPRLRPADRRQEHGEPLRRDSDRGDDACSSGIFEAKSAKIEAAVLEAVRQKKTTQDIGGSLGTREAGEWVAKRVQSTALSS